MAFKNWCYLKISNSVITSNNAIRVTEEEEEKISHLVHRGKMHWIKDTIYVYTESSHKLSSRWSWVVYQRSENTSGIKCKVVSAASGCEDCVYRSIVWRILFAACSGTAICCCYHQMPLPNHKKYGCLLEYLHYTLYFRISCFVFQEYNTLQSIDHC